MVDFGSELKGRIHGDKEGGSQSLGQLVTLILQKAEM